ncbi:MAG TPA: hypothetical protein VIN61_14170 [Gammaproteobacteria bacterium]
MRKALFWLLLTGAVSCASADVLLLDGLEMARQTADSRPARGMTMQRVEARFGTPDARSGPVGDPPITRWDYPGFSVYFEYEHVIHAVVRR